jgi:hypothetical protein
VKDGGWTIDKGWAKDERRKSEEKIKDTWRKYRGLRSEVGLQIV